MGLPAQKISVAPAQQATGPQRRKLKKGELLFSEGDTSRAMYLIKSGLIRVYKRKGNSCIEIDTVHSGQILGELAFLDGNPRSASAEALTESEIVEIGGSTFASVLGTLPDWLKVLLKTVVGRLRTAGTRIKQLESSNLALDYSDKEGRSTQYMFLSGNETMRLCAAALLVASRNHGELKPALVQRYATQVMQVASAKVATFLDVLVSGGIAEARAPEKEGDAPSYVVSDLEFVESLIAYLNEENLAEPSKRHDLSLKGFKVMHLMTKYLPESPTDEKTGVTRVNVAQIIKAEAQNDRPPFKLEDANELHRLGYASQPKVVSTDEIFCEVDAAAFSKAFRFQRFCTAVTAINEEKRQKTK